MPGRRSPQALTTRRVHHTDRSHNYCRGNRRRGQPYRSGDTKMEHWQLKTPKNVCDAQVAGHGNRPRRSFVQREESSRDPNQKKKSGKCQSSDDSKSKRKTFSGGGKKNGTKHLKITIRVVPNSLCSRRGDLRRSSKEQGWDKKKGQ